MPEGATVQISHAASRDTIVKATEEAVRTSVDGYPGKEPLAALCFPGASRKQLLGTRIDEEYLVFKSSYPHLPVAGFYNYGQFAPLKKGLTSRFHNQTFLNLVLGLR